MTREENPVRKSVRPPMNFIHLDECRDRLCAGGPVRVDRAAFVRSLMHCTPAERREVADLLILEKFGEV